MKSKTFQARQGDILLIGMQDPDEQAIGQATEVDRQQGALVIATGESSGHRHQVTARGAKLFARGSMAAFLHVTAKGGAAIEVTGDRGQPLPHVRHGAIALPEGKYEIRRQREWSADRERHVRD